ncbi:MAG: SRPBCC family protein [Saprospiraceae bacterium]|nr:SRPBCC family protein [Saprospiraceae bacterium]
MAIYHFIRTQKLPASRVELWDFISSPANLKEITPDYMGFEVTNILGVEKMYPGMIIAYKVSPLFGLKLNWLTEITHVKDFEYFVDEQRVGPYSLWHHQHKLENIEGGVLMTDIVTYKPPMGILGIIANFLFIEKKLDEIFDYRKIVLEKKFGKFES